MSSALSAIVRPWRQAGPLPGLGLTLGISLAWLSLIVLIPLIALLVKAAGLGPQGWWAIASDERVLSAMKLSFGTALIAALVILVAISENSIALVGVLPVSGSLNSFE